MEGPPLLLFHRYFLALSRHSFVLSLPVYTLTAFPSESAYTLTSQPRQKVRAISTESGRNFPLKNQFSYDIVHIKYVMRATSPKINKISKQRNPLPPFCYYTGGASLLLFQGRYHPGRIRDIKRC
jgi:hypothetical protein